VALGD